MDGHFGEVTINPTISDTQDEGERSSKNMHVCLIRHLNERYRDQKLNSQFLLTVKVSIMHTIFLNMDGSSPERDLINETFLGLVE